jgi:hypothetical protein
LLVGSAKILSTVVSDPCASPAQEVRLRGLKVPGQGLSGRGGRASSRHHLPRHDQMVWRPRRHCRSSCGSGFVVVAIEITRARTHSIEAALTSYLSLVERFVDNKGVIDFSQQLAGQVKDRSRPLRSVWLLAGRLGHLRRHRTAAAIGFAAAQLKPSQRSTAP